MKKLFIFALSCVSLSYQSFAQENNYNSKIHAPIGIMRDHVHDKGEFMFSYRYSQMSMENLRQGDDGISTAQVLDSYANTPIKMNMQMHMAGLMYGFTDKLTIGAMSGFVVKDMDHAKNNGTYFERESEGLSDSKVNAMYRFFENDNNDTAQINLGVSLPTGDINESHTGTRLPYPMQIGSGSYEFLPGISSTLILKNGFRVGGQINGTFRMDSNKYGYKLGDNYNVTSWVDKSLDEDVSVSARLDYNKNEAIEGFDSEISSMKNGIPTADASLTDSQRLDILFGVSLFNGLGVEFGLPLYQRVDGPTLETKYRFIVGWQKSF